MIVVTLTQTELAQMKTSVNGIVGVFTLLCLETSTKISFQVWQRSSCCTLQLHLDSVVLFPNAELCVNPNHHVKGSLFLHSQFEMKLSGI